LTAANSFAKSLGVQSVPTIAIDGKLAECCVGRGLDEAALRAMGIGQPWTAQALVRMRLKEPFLKALRPA